MHNMFDVCTLPVAVAQQDKDEPNSSSCSLLLLMRVFEFIKVSVFEVLLLCCNGFGWLQAFSAAEGVVEEITVFFDLLLAYRVY